MFEGVIYTPEAEQDVVDAYSWYEARGRNLRCGKMLTSTLDGRTLPLMPGMPAIWC